MQQITDCWFQDQVAQTWVFLYWFSAQHLIQTRILTRNPATPMNKILEWPYSEKLEIQSDHSLPVLFQQEEGTCLTMFAIVTVVEPLQYYCVRDWMCTQACVIWRIDIHYVTEDSSSVLSILGCNFCRINNSFLSLEIMLRCWVSFYTNFFFL